MKEEKIRKQVRKRYGKIAETSSSCCPPSTSTCGCDTQSTVDMSKIIGYSDNEINSVPEGANLGLGCGNPTALASLKEGERVLDLGSGAGFDVFLAAKKVGKTGKVIGVDMTPQMLDKARANAQKGKYANVEFRLGEIENLPVADSSVDVVISNCVINLSPDKKRVFEEAFRILGPNGRLMVSDIVLLEELPEVVRKNAEAYGACVAGAEIKSKYLGLIEKAGFRDVKVVEETNFPIEDVLNEPSVKKILKSMRLSSEQLKKLEKSVVSIKVSAVKS
jgi:SAM-dependent methyltransferase